MFSEFHWDKYVSCCQDYTNTPTRPQTAIHTFKNQLSFMCGETTVLHFKVPVLMKDSLSLNTVISPKNMRESQSSIDLDGFLPCHPVSCIQDLFVAKTTCSLIKLRTTSRAGISMNRNLALKILTNRKPTTVHSLKVRRSILISACIVDVFLDHHHTWMLPVLLKMMFFYFFTTF